MRNCVFEIGNSNLGTRKLATTCQPALAWRTLRLPRLLDLQCCLPPWEQFSGTVPPTSVCLHNRLHPCAHHSRSLSVCPPRPKPPSAGSPNLLNPHCSTCIPWFYLGSIWFSPAFCVGGTGFHTRGVLRSLLRLASGSSRSLLWIPSLACYCLF